MTRDELILLVDKIMKCQGTEKEIDEMIKLLKKNVIDPEVTNYIFFEENTPEEVVDKALAYKPIWITFYILYTIICSFLHMKTSFTLNTKLLFWVIR